jgi:hypothetical protein
MNNKRKKKKRRVGRAAVTGRGPGLNSTALSAKAAVEEKPHKENGKGTVSLLTPGLEIC